VTVNEYDNWVPTVPVAGAFRVTFTSAPAVSVSESVADSLPGAESVTRAGSVAVAVLSRVPVAAGLIAAVTVYVTDPPAGIVSESLMLPAPAVAPVAPPARLNVRDADVIAAGNVSVKVIAETVLGPAFDTVMVYVT